MNPNGRLARSIIWFCNEVVDEGWAVVYNAAFLVLFLCVAVFATNAWWSFAVWALLSIRYAVLTGIVFGNWRMRVTSDAERC